MTDLTENPKAPADTITIVSDAPPPLQLKRAILIYEGDREALFTEHKVENGAIQAGTPLETNGFLRSFSHINFAQAPVLDDFALIDHPRLLAWWRPAGKTPLFGEAEGDFGAFPRVALHLPAMVFVASPGGGRLSVRALGTSARPAAATPLSILPLPNIYDSGDICLGMRNTEDVRSRQEWERLFFETRFNHTHYHRKFHRHPEGPKAMLQAMRTNFDPAWLQPTNQTLNAFIAEISRA